MDQSWDPWKDWPRMLARKPCLEVHPAQREHRKGYARLTWNHKMADGHVYAVVCGGLCTHTVSHSMTLYSVEPYQSSIQWSSCFAREYLTTPLSSSRLSDPRNVKRFEARRDPETGKVGQVS